MKKIFTKLMLWAVAAAALVSCENNLNEESAPVVDLLQTVTLSAEKPTEVRTELIEGVPYWSKGDQIGVYVVDGESYKNYAFKNDSEEASLTTSFTGTTAVANTLFVYYPYTNFSTPVTEKGVKVEILANQEPTAASFDGRTDLMIAKPVTLDAEGKQLSDLEFARVAAIVKIVLKDKTGNLAGQHVSSLTMTAANNLVGRVYLDVVNQAINSEEGLYYGGAPSVNATYTEATQYEVDGTNATYVVVYPQTLTAGSKLSFEAVTEGYAISKEITLPSDIELLAGKVTTLNVSLAAENVVAEATGLALPFEDDFAWVTGTNENTDITASLKGEFYTTGVKAFSANGAIKFGTGSVAGSITTVPLNLSEPFTVIVKAKKYGSDNAKIKAVVGETSQQITLTADYAYYGIEFEAATKKSSLTMEAVNASNCRFYIDELQVVAGHDVVLPTLPPVLTVNVESITSISHEGENVTFVYSVANPVEGTSVVITDDADWITTADNNGTVTVTVAENTLEEVRNATITVKYGDLTETVAVQQNAKPAEGSATENTVTYTVSSTSACTTSGTAPTGSSATYKQTYTTKEQLTSGNSATFTLTGYEGATIKGITLNMKSNASKGAGTFSVVAGSTTLASIASATTFNKWYDNTSYGSTYRDIHVTLTNNAYVIKSGESVVVKFEATTNSIYVHSITIDYEIGGGTTEPEPEPDQPGTGGGDSAEPVTVTMSTFSSTSASMDSVISYTTAKGGGTADPAINGSVIRLYQNASGTGGGYITITAASGHKISSVTIGSSMATKVAYTVDGDTTKSASSSLAANGKYTVTEDAQSITIHCMGTSSSSRLYVNYLSVTYK